MSGNIAVALFLILFGVTQLVTTPIPSWCVGLAACLAGLVVLAGGGWWKRTPVLAVGAGLSLLVSGCSSFRSIQRETAPDGSIRETTLKARTFFNARSDLAKLRASTTDKTQGMTIGALGQTADGSNVVTLVGSLVGAAVEAGIKAGTGK